MTANQGATALSGLFSGVELRDAASLTTTTGAINVTGRSGDTSGGFSGNNGVSLLNTANITSNGSGTITLIGNGGVAPDNSIGGAGGYRYTE